MLPEELKQNVTVYVSFSPSSCKSSSPFRWVEAEEISAAQYRWAALELDLKVVRQELASLLFPIRSGE
jgi:hypothetical protein